MVRPLAGANDPLELTSQVTEKLPLNADAQKNFTISKPMKCVRELENFQIEHHDAIKNKKIITISRFIKIVLSILIYVVKLFLVQVIDETKSMSDIPEWFHGSRLNYAENLLRFKDNKVAIYATGLKITTG